MTRNTEEVFQGSCYIFATTRNQTQRVLFETAPAVCQLLLLSICLSSSNLPFLSPKNRVCCAGFDHWREVLSLYSTRQVRFAVPPSVTVIFCTRGYWPLTPATWHTGERSVWEEEDVSGGRRRGRYKGRQSETHVWFDCCICEDPSLIKILDGFIYCIDVCVVIWYLLSSHGHKDFAKITKPLFRSTTESRHTAWQKQEVWFQSLENAQRPN